MAQGVLGFFQACVWVIWNVCLYWQRQLWLYMTTKTPKQLLVETLQCARQYEEWVAAAHQLDYMVGNHMWRRASADYPINYYEDLLIEDRANAFEDAIEDRDIMKIHNLLRTGLSRNLGGILHARLYSKANAGTKLLIEEYIMYASKAIQEYSRWPLTPEEPLTPQMKMDLLHDARMSYGRSVLVLQGGSIFGLCHLGVVKAMYQRNLLPRIIAGSATGALMAAWVGVHTEKELLGILSGDRIDLSAFVASSKRAAAEAEGDGSWLWLRTLYRRVIRFFRSGFILDPKVLEESVRANVGDMTFEEAYNKTQRILNITISPSGPGSITLLNYLTAPHVLIWSAALVSNANTRSRTSPRLMCKDVTGRIVPYQPVPSMKPLLLVPVAPQESPLSRLGELFNVDHFIVSQARPYIAPFLYPTLRRVKTSFSGYLTRFILNEFQHRLKQLDIIGILSPGLKRLLMDEIVPGPSITLVPEIRLSDWVRLLRNPTEAEIDHWIDRGERSVWPNVINLWVRFGVENELEKAYQRIRRGDVDDEDDQPLKKPVRKRAKRVSGNAQAQPSTLRAL